MRPREAMKAACDPVCASLRQRHLNLDDRIEIGGEANQRLMTVTVRDAFTRTG